MKYTVACHFIVFVSGPLRNDVSVAPVQQILAEFEFYLTFSVFSIRKMFDRIERIALIGYKYFHSFL